MECPHCHETLRVIDREPAPPGTFIRLACPARGCGEELVALVHDDGLAPLTTRQVRRHAVRVVFNALRTDFTFPIAGAIGTALLTVLLAVWQYLNPSPNTTDAASVIAIIVGGLAIIAIFGASIVVDLAVGVSGWRSALPRPLIDVKAPPRDYRT